MLSGSFLFLLQFFMQKKITTIIWLTFGTKILLFTHLKSINFQENFIYFVFQIKYRMMIRKGANFHHYYLKKLNFILGF